MKNLLTNLFNSSFYCHAKRLAMAVMLLSFATVATAGGDGGNSNKWEARFYMNNNVQLLSGSTGSGKVYLEDVASGLTDNYSNYKTNIELGPQTNLDGNQFHVYNTNVTIDESQKIAGTLRAEAFPGSEFKEWTFASPVVLSPDANNHDAEEGTYPTSYNPQIYGDNNEKFRFEFDLNGNDNISLIQTSAIYAEFMARTYYAMKHPNVEVITIDQDGNLLQEVGGSTPGFLLSDAAPSGVTMGIRDKSFDNYFSQTADNAGKNACASFIWTFDEDNPPVAYSTFTYLGWKTTPGDYLTHQQPSAMSVQATAVSENSNSPTQHTIYIIYQREKFNLFWYDAPKDQFNVMEATSMAGDVANYRYSNNEVKEQLFRILSGKSGALTISETTHFTTTLEKINNMDILRVVPNNTTGGEETVTISVDGTSVATLEISMLSEGKSVTLNPAENLEGTYVYKQNTTGDQEFLVNNAPITKVLVNLSDFTFSFNPNPISGYAFKRWRVEKPGEQPTYYVTPNLQITFAGGESITPEFETVTDRAAFIVNGSPDVLYYDLQAAIEAAKKTSKVVAVHTNGVLKHGNYIIDGGVTLLIPGKDPTNGKYDVLTKELSKDNFKPDGGVGTWNQYRTLVVEDNTTIDVKDGNISLYAQLSSGHTSAPAGRANYFGVMVLGTECKITVSKGGLYAYGYIIGDNSSEIIMKKGTVVYEAFQFTDFRGGSATQSWFDGFLGIGAGNLKDSEVFPMGQYYIQNVEVPLTLEYGATEWLSTAVYMSESVQNANMLFLGQIGQNNDKGLLCLGEGTTITKTYDPYTDRLSLFVKGPKAKLSYMELSLSIVTLSSYEFIMPIMNNMDIFVEGTQLEMYTNAALAFMPGSTLTISSNSDITVNSNNRLYFYDHDERMFTDGTGYWGSDNAKLKPLIHRPANTWKFTSTLGQKSNGENMLYTRQEKDLVDAKMVLNGSMTLNGPLYTTAGGANITSDGGGKIVVNKLGTETTTKQVTQTNTSVSEKTIPLSSLSSPNLKLHNRETTSINTTDFAGTDYYKFQNYTDVSANGTYIYYQSEGVWKAPEATISGYKIYNKNDEEIESFEVTLPTDKVEGYVLCQLVPVSGVDYTKDDFEFSLDGDSYELDLENVVVNNNQIKIPVAYTAQNKHNVDPGVSATLTVSKSTTAATAINVNETINLVAYENYQPDFTVSNSVVVRSSLKETNGEWDVYVLNVQIPENNSAGLAEGDNASAAVNDNTFTLTGDNASVVWTAAISGDDADQFSFQFGETTSAIKNAAVLFRPTSPGIKSATLTLTVQYMDNANPSNILTKQEVINLSGEGTISDNTMDFANVGSIKQNSTFDLLTTLNSSAELSYTIEPQNQDVINIFAKTDEAGKPNYSITALKVGSVKITVTQMNSDVVSGKTITRTIVVQSDAGPLQPGGSCVENKESFNKLTADYENVNFAVVDTEPIVSFNTTSEKKSATWSLQFTSMPGYIQFTPSGVGQWSLQESTSGMPGSWIELLAWTEFESGKPVFLPVSPETRAITISYYGTTPGALTDICVYPLTLVPENNVIYMPIRNGQINENVSFTHNVGSGSIEIKDSENNSWGSTIASPENLGGLLQVYYRTSVTIKKTGVTPGSYNLTASLGSSTANLTIIAYEIPYDLPILSTDWGESDFYHYMNEASHELDNHYVKWNAEQKKVVFTSVENLMSSDRYVVFGFHGYPTDMRFNSTSRDWTIYSSEDAKDWIELTTEVVPIADESGIYTIKRELYHTAKYVKIVCSANSSSEMAIENLQIVGSEVVEVKDPSPSNPADLTYAELEISRDGEGEAVNTFTIFVANIEQLKVELNSSEFEMKRKSPTDDSWLDMPENNLLRGEHYSILGSNMAGDLTFQVKWVGQNIVNEGLVSIKNASDELLANIKLVGKKSTITADDANTGIYTGVPQAYQLIGSNFEDYPYHEVNVQNAFDMNKEPLFDYLFIYGETTTTDASTLTEDGKIIITQPRIENELRLGSNAKTPYYIYKRNEASKGYDFVQLVENANTGSKASLDKIDHEETILGEENRITYAIKPDGETPLNVYITGFCPYATTGSTKDEEGVWYFRGDPGQTLNIYLEDCHIYSRNKSENGGPTAKNVSPSFSEGDVVHGSGAVLVFENSIKETSNAYPFNVTIHTRGHNLLKSNFGCYYTMILNAQVTQVSSPVQIRLGTKNDYLTAKTTLNFDDLWPINSKTTTRTNGFLSLQKLVNNAPSIDLGNPNTIVNFNGGQVQLQNAQIVSPNYKTTLAISHRSGEFGNLGFEFAYGVGTDAVGGTVNFNDGTTTVLPMYVSPSHTSNYLLDKDADGNYIKNSKGEFLTSCLRCPTNTYVYGGSHCMIRACGHVTSKGGAPKDGPDGNFLGRYVYKNDPAAIPAQGYTFNEGVMTELPTDLSGYGEGAIVIVNMIKYQLVVSQNGEKAWKPIAQATFTDPYFIVTPTNFPGDLTYNDAPLKDYYLTYPTDEYGLQSVTPDDKGNLYFWIPEGVVPSVTPEQDKLITAWKACMTEIEAAAMGLGGSIGGSTVVEKDEEVVNLVYCQIDQDMHDVISEPLTEDDEGNVTAYKYAAPVVDPTGKLEGDDRYQMVHPTFVSDSVQHSIISNGDYMVTSKVYYITTAQADTWMNFSMPFDVEKIWVVESYSEQAIIDFFRTAPADGEKNKTELTMQFQAHHNADFASFFGVAMAIGADHMDFEGIFNNYLDWAQNRADRVGVEGSSNLYNGDGTYDLRGKYNLVHYNGSNFNTSHFYLYENVGDWATQTVNDKLEFAAEWQIVPKVQEGKAIMQKDKVYALLFPYCLGCDVELDVDNNIKLDDKGLPIINERDYWDYWSGKFLIFESTQASADKPHIIKGSNYVAESKEGQDKWIYDNIEMAENSAALLGNSTFSMMSLSDNAYKNQLYTYSAERGRETYKKYDSNIGPDLLVPTSTILLTGMTNQPKMITRSGQIIYDQPDDDNNGNQNGTSGHMPTVGGGNDLFVTSIAGGINVAVAAPQNVRVLSSTGAVIYSGYVTTAVDIQLPTTGIYIVSGEYEVQKILF